MHVCGCLAVWVVCCYAALAGSLTAPPYGEIDSDRLMEHIRWLAHDQLRGRGTGTPDQDRAAAYIAKQLEAIGCEPAGDVDDWYQTFKTFPVNQLNDVKAKLHWVGADAWPVLRRDWVPMPFSAVGGAAGEVAFAGYGIQTTGYDDYAGFEAEGKILLMLRYEPPETARFRLLDDEYPSIHSTFARKAQVADEQGAEALLIVNPPSRSSVGDGLYPFAPMLGNRLVALPIIHISPAFANQLLAAGGLPPIAELEADLNRDRRPRSGDLEGVRLEIEQGLRRDGMPSRNVLGLLRATEPTNSYVIVGAHYDHLGWRVAPGQRRPELHNGADDNASGVAGMLEIARLMSQQPARDRHVLFMAFGAEELSLLGSIHFVQNPLVPLNRIRAMINLDMIGRLYGGDVQLYFDQDDPVFRRTLRRATRRLGIDYQLSDEFKARSDQAPFANEGIPTLFAHSGMHADYHRPSDDWERIDPLGTAQITTLLAEVVGELVVATPALGR